MDWIEVCRALFQLLGWWGYDNLDEWLRERYRQLRTTVILMIMIGIVVIVPGAFFGGISWNFKLWWLIIGLMFLGWRSAVYAANQADIGILIAALIGLRKRPEQGLIRKSTAALIEGAKDYARLVGAFLVSEMAVGLIALIVPAHNNPGLAFIALPATMLVVSHIVWKGGGEWWVPFTKRLGYGLLFLPLVGIVLPDPFSEVTTYQDRLNIGLWELIVKKASLETVAVLNMILIPSFLIASASVKDPTTKRLLGFAAFLVVVLDLRWFFWGDGVRYLQPPARPAAVSGVAGASAASKPVWPAEVFRGNAGQVMPVVVMDVGWRYTVHSTHDWKLISTRPDGTIKEYDMPAGMSGLVGTFPREIVKMRFRDNGTEIKFQRTS